MRASRTRDTTIKSADYSRTQACSRDSDIPHDHLTAEGLLTMFATEVVRCIGVAVGRTITGNQPTTAIPAVLPSRVAHVSRLRRISASLVRSQRARLAICLGLTWLSLGQVAQAADDQPAQEVVARVARLFTSQTSNATVDMQITKPDFQRKISMQFWSVGEFEDSRPHSPTAGGRRHGHPESWRQRLDVSAESQPYG